MRDTGHWNEAFLGEKGPDYHFALDFVQTDISSEFLYQQFQACQAERDDGYCLGNACLACGACSNGEQRRAITQHQIRRAESEPYLAQLKQIESDKRRLKPLYLRLYLMLPGGRSGARRGMRPEFVEAVVFKELVSRFPEWIDNLLSVQENLFTLRANRALFPPSMMCGEHIFALKAWDVESIQQTLETLGGVCLPSFRILGVADQFAPGVYSRIDLEITLPASHFAEPRRKLETYLRSTYLPYTLQRQGNGYIVNVPDKGRKKQVLYEGYIEPGETDFVARLGVGSKFDLMAWLNLFDQPQMHYHAQIEVTQVTF
jgi:hypothetical protein